MSSDKCKKCGTENAYSYLCMLQYSGLYFVCHKCLDEWHDNGYYEIWRTLYHADNIELADKFTLDFLEKLG